MLRLETVEDFERVFNALKSPESDFSEFFVRPYGFCKVCKCVTAYEPAKSCTGIINMNLVFACLHCGRIFEVHGSGGGVVTEYYLTGKNIPEEERQQVEQLNSREEQCSFFKTTLQEQIRRLKSEERKIRSKIRLLARLEL